MVLVIEMTFFSYNLIKKKKKKRKIKQCKNSYNVIYVQMILFE